MNRPRKLKILFPILVGLLTFVTMSVSVFAINVGDTLPDIKVVDYSGKTSTPWQGQVALINLWATWCDACKIELHEMADEMAKNTNNEKTYFVSLDKEPAQARDYMNQEFKAASPMAQNLFFDNEFKLADGLNVESFPTTVIVGKNGKVLKIQQGFQPGSTTTTELFLELRKQSKISLSH